MSQNDPLLITDERVISGLLREALFHSRRVEIITDTQTIALVVDDLIEPSSREKNVERLVRLTLIDKPKDPKILKNLVEIEFRCGFPKFHAFWTAHLEAIEGGFYQFKVPKIFRIENARSGVRVKLNRQDILRSTVLVTTQELSTEGYLVVEEFSSNGLAGQLRVIAEMPIAIGTTITGRIASKTGYIDVRGTIAKAECITQASSYDGDSTYSIGIDNKPTQLLIPRVEERERRKSPRVQVKLNLDIVSPFRPDHVIHVKVTNASCSGFICELANPADSVLLPLGCMGTFCGSLLLVRVVGITESEYRMELAGGTDSERLSWLKLLSPFLNPQTSFSTPTGMDIIELFCESGASAAGYLKNQRRFVQEFVEGYTSIGESSPWIHRWIERDNGGEIRGHVSVVRISDQTWYLGDIAGMANKTRKISPNFLANFMGYFRDFAISSTPCPTVLLSWVEGHPFWKKWEESLNTTDKATVIGFTRASYHRLPSAKTAASSNGFSRQPNWILPSDFEVISKIRESLTEMGLLFLADFFDLSIKSFESPILNRLLNQNGQTFKRSYCKISYGGLSFLIIFQKFPTGSSPLKTADVPWLIPLDNASIGPQVFTEVLNLVREVGIEKGYSFPGVIFSRTDESNEQGIKHMLWTLVHPNGLREIYSQVGGR